MEMAVVVRGDGDRKTDGDEKGLVGVQGVLVNKRKTHEITSQTGIPLA
jgi:hypothetical protein